MESRPDNLSAAFEMDQRAVQHYRELEHPSGQSVALNNLAYTLMQMGRGEQAIETAQESLRLVHQHVIEQQKETQAALEKLASIDPLTGLFNRRRFFELGEREIQRARQEALLDRVDRTLYAARQAGKK